MEQKNNTPFSQVAEITLSYSMHVNVTARPTLTTSKHAYDVFLQSWDMQTIELAEHFKVMLLNRANRVLGIYALSTGGVTGTVADPRLIFAAALKANATNIILAHNHPSGHLAPSTADSLMTRKIIDGGKLLDITVMDHLIISLHGFYSFSDEGMI
jgi:DNA repair protein RadC